MAVRDFAVDRVHWKAKPVCGLGGRHAGGLGGGVAPDNPHADDYKALMGTATALPFGDAVRHPVNFWGPARVLSLDGRWFSCTIRHYGGPLWITHAAERVVGGMSGSPIVAEAGTAIGVVCTITSPREGGPNARLSHNLPGWLLRDPL